MNLVHSEWPQIIEDILDRGGLPVIVGGTNFYIQVHSLTQVNFHIFSFIMIQCWSIPCIKLCLYLLFWWELLQCLRLLLAHSCLRIWQTICRVAL